MSDEKKLEWNEKYSVDVVEIDEQHRQLFVIINQIIDAIGQNLTEENLTKIINSLLEYKKRHFETEEKYFKEFNYEGAEEHIAEHKKFSEKIGEFQKKYSYDTLTLTFRLVDFLEDWLIDHLMNVDQKYKDCFKAHGLK